MMRASFPGGTSLLVVLLCLLLLAGCRSGVEPLQELSWETAWTGPQDTARQVSGCSHSNQPYIAYTSREESTDSSGKHGSSDSDPILMLYLVRPNGEEVPGESGWRTETRQTRESRATRHFFLLDCSGETPGLLDSDMEEARYLTPEEPDQPLEAWEPAVIGEPSTSMDDLSISSGGGKTVTSFMQRDDLWFLPPFAEDAESAKHRVETGCSGCFAGEASSMALWDSRYAITYHLSAPSSVRIAVSRNSDPERLEDWERETISTNRTMEQVDTELLISRKGPVVAYYEFESSVSAIISDRPTPENLLRIAVPGKPVFSDEEQWNVYSIDSGLEKQERAMNISGTLLGGKPAFAYKDGSVIKLARAKVAQPESAEDWKISSVAKVGEQGGWPNLMELNGMPAIAYYDELERVPKLVVASEVSGDE